ncbi:multicopper oxidase family protein [Nonomuraea sp. bgisy101]|uniref:multicopper oxidase family protein n=1 Tax=Nonomuraea sp. bgisy101 TaxID=3413784 RepID=UPI003D71ECDF
MFVTIDIVSAVLSALAFLVWMPLAFLVERLSRRTVHWWLTAGLASLAAKSVATVMLLVTFGWRFAADQVLIEIPFVLLPAVIACLRSDRVMVVRLTAAASLLGFFHAFTVKAETPNVFGYGAMLFLAFLILRAWAIASPRVSRVVRMSAFVLAAVVLAASGFAYGSFTSRWPKRHTMAAAGPSHGHGDRRTAAPSVDLTTLHGPRTGIPDRTFTLTAAETAIKLTSGAPVAAWTFNAQVPGPELRVKQGDLVEVTLVNRLPKEGVTLHWHGLDVPNAEDGVAGLTQDAVRPGGTHIYRFRADRAGTYWYHTHQASSTAVVRGLFGAIVVERAEQAREEFDTVVMSHAWPVGDEPRPAFGAADTLTRKAVQPGTAVRLRLVNTGNNTVSDAEATTFALTGTPYRVAAIDGGEVREPGELRNLRLSLATGGRYDLTFTMPNGPVYLADLAAPGKGLLLSPDGTGTPETPVLSGDFDPAQYGRPAPTPFDASSRFDRQFTIVASDGVGFVDGSLDLIQAFNGRLYPDVPMQMVRKGDLVKMTLINRSRDNHPMHLHGHHALVMSANGRAVTGSPWWIDTLDLPPGTWFEIGFRADNPGLWMDHCHNLDHAAAGMLMHLGYEGVTTPFESGSATGNMPE